MNYRIKDITGMRFGRLFAIEPTDKRLGRNVVWSFRCDCGTLTMKASGKVICGDIRSCGCLVSETASNLRRTHGMGKTSIYGVWAKMKDRCLNFKSEYFHRYGGRGIKVCDRWMIFENFYQDMGKKPHLKSQIDRIDNDGNYEPINCRWATPTENANNKSNNRFLTVGEKTQTVSQWARETGLSDRTIRSRLQIGWSEEDAITKPLRILQ